LEIAGFQSSSYFQQIKNGIDALSPEERKQAIGKVKGVFQFDIKNAEGKVESWFLDLKDQGIVGIGKPNKPDITIIIADADFVDLAQGKLNGQKAFMSGKLKVKGKMMLATKLGDVLKSAQPKNKL